ncbi:MAG: hypothetical protein V1726_00875, partial [Methanobacteriota archaeon]
LDRNYPSGYQKDVWYHEILYINSTEYSFSTGMKILFQCDASNNEDMVYIDQVYINATSMGRHDYEFTRFSSTDIDPRTPSYSIGGTGDFDPDYAAFNRTGVDLSNYEDVIVSVWYSYKNTEATDFFGLYYYDNNAWFPIFEVADPEMSGGQINWTHAEIDVPDSLDTLILQFRWMTSSIAEYVAIDDLEITGRPTGGANYTGLIDEFRIYTRVLTAEQIYQNYLCTKDGYSNKSVIVAEETIYGDIWICQVTPNDSIQDDQIFESDPIQIGMYP